MSVSQDYLDEVLERLAPAMEVTAKRMFGGVGLYSKGLFFGVMDDDILYLKVDDTNRPDYEAHGCEAFRPGDAPNTMPSMKYFNVPDEVMEEPELLQAWAMTAVGVAARAKKPKKG